MSAEFDPTAAFEQVMALSHDNPQFFFEHVLNAKPRRWQRELHEEIRQRLARGERHLQIHVRAAHGAGKGFESAGLVLWWQSTRPGARCLTTAPNWRDVEQLLWAEIRTLYAGSLLKIAGIGRMLTTMWDCDNGWFATGASSDKPENLEGQHSLIAACRVVDEAKAVPDPVFTATEGLLSSMETLDVWISTPSARIGKFYERDLTAGPELIRRVVTIEDLIADGVPGALRWKQQALIEYGGEDNFEYQSRAMANYIDNAEGMLFPFSWVERAMMSDEERIKAGLRAFHVTGKWPTLGFDVAGSIAGDENAVAVTFGPDSLMRYEITDIYHWHELDTMVSKDRAVEYGVQHKARCLRADVQGLGKAVCDAIIREKTERGLAGKPLPFFVEEYRSADPAKDPERFLNAKAENAWAMRLALEKDMIRLPKQATLRKQMAAMKYEVRNGKIRVIDPDDSPDHWDAVLMGIGGPLRSVSKGDIGGTPDPNPWGPIRKDQSWANPPGWRA